MFPAAHREGNDLKVDTANLKAGKPGARRRRRAVFETHFQYAIIDNYGSIYLLFACRTSPLHSVHPGNLEHDPQVVQDLTNPGAMDISVNPPQLQEKVTIKAVQLRIIADFQSKIGNGI